MNGDLSNTAAGTATVGDFADHMTTVFTDVRLKRFLEMRGADAGTLEMMVAQSALWVGLLYDDAALTAAAALVRRHRWQDFAALRAAGAAPGTRHAVGQSGTVRDLARDLVAIARDGLRARARLQFGRSRRNHPPGAAGGDRRRRADAGGGMARGISRRVAW